MEQIAGLGASGADEGREDETQGRDTRATNFHENLVTFN